MNGILFGCFDILHYGHIRAIKYCLSQCSNLTIGLFTDEAIRTYKSKPSIPYKDREAMLQEIFPQVTVIPVAFRNWQSFPKDKTYDILFVSETYRNAKLHMYHYSFIIDICYIPHTKGISSTQIKNRILFPDDVWEFWNNEKDEWWNNVS